MVIEMSLPHFDVMNRDQSLGLRMTCVDDGDTACFIHHWLFSCRGCGGEG